MGAGAYQLQFVSGDAIDQQPIRFNVRVAIPFPDTLERVVPVMLCELLARNQSRQ